MRGRHAEKNGAGWWRCYAMRRVMGVGGEDATRKRGHYETRSSSSQVWDDLRPSLTCWPARTHVSLRALYGERPWVSVVSERGLHLDRSRSGYELNK